jgi:glycine betaine catabolism B
MVAVKVEGYTRVASVDEMPPGIMRKVDVDGKEVLLANIDGKYYAIENVCTHRGGPLDEGRLHQYEVECPWHSSRFDLRTGYATQGPADIPEPSYEVMVEGNSILLRAK